MSSSINKEYLNKVQGQIIYRLPNLINKPTILHTNENNSISFLLSLINSIDSLISTDSFYNQLGLAFGKKFLHHHPLPTLNLLACLPFLQNISPVS